MGGGGLGLGASAGGGLGLGASPAAEDGSGPSAAQQMQALLGFTPAGASAAAAAATTATPAAQVCPSVSAAASLVLCGQGVLPWQLDSDDLGITAVSRTYLSCDAPTERSQEGPVAELDLIVCCVVDGTSSSELLSLLECCILKGPSHAERCQGGPLRRLCQRV